MELKYDLLSERLQVRVMTSEK